MAQFTFINFKDSTTMMTTTNTTVFKRIGNMLSLIFSDYYEARGFRSSFMRLVTYTVLFIIGYRLNLVFGNVPDGRIFDGYAMAALFCGLSVLSGFMNNMICIGGCLTMLLFMVIKLAISMAIGIIALPICVAYNLYNIVKMGAVPGEIGAFPPSLGRRNPPIQS